MIERILPLQFLKKSAFLGSYSGMRYRLNKLDDELEVYTWPEPFSFVSTPEENKTRAMFAFSEEGYDEALAYLNQIYNNYI